MANEDDLVSKVDITGTEKATADLNKMGDAGAAAFNKIGDAADKNSAKISKATGALGEGINKLPESNRLSQIARGLGEIGTVVGQTGTAIGAAGLRIGAFGVTMKALGVASVGAVIGLGKFASSITQAARVSYTAVNDQLQIQKKMLEQTNQTAQTSAQYSANVGKLNREWAAGKITGTEYNAQLRELRESYNDQVQVQREVAAAQLDTLKSQQALERQAKQREAFDALARTYGTTLTSSLIRLGNQYDSVYRKVTAAFGPVIAKLVDSVATLIEKNSVAITTFITNASTSMQKFLDENRTTIGEVITFVSELGTAARDLIMNVLIPAFRGLMTVLDTVATAINGIFGTDINGKFLLLVGTILALTGGFSALYSVVQLVVVGVAALVSIFGAIPVAIGLIVAALAIFASTLDWKGYAESVKAAWGSVVEFFTSSLAAISAGWQTMVDYVTGLWTSFTGFITSSFNSALSAISTYISGWATTLMGYIQPIIDKLKQLAALLSSTGGEAGGAGFAGGGHVRGAGTSTSDSIPAWLSNNEFVVRAKAVAKYGVGFMRALNSGRLDLGKIAGYAMGGLVTQPTQPRYGFATGGLVNNPRNADRVLNLTIGNETFNGLMMPEEVGNKLTKYAVGRQTRSAGKKPSWVGGNR